MKKILFLLLTLFSFASFAQVKPSDSAKYIHYPYTYGIWYPKIIGDQVVIVPADTVYSKNGIAVKGSSLYFGNGIKWTAISGGSYTDAMARLTQSANFPLVYNNSTGVHSADTTGTATSLVTIYQLLQHIHDSLTANRDTTVAKSPIHYITGGPHDSIAIYIATRHQNGYLDSLVYQGFDSGYNRYALVGSTLTLYRRNGDSSVISLPGGGGSPNTSVGSGYRVAINGTNNIKSLTGGLWITLDSTVSNQVNFKVDSASMATYFLRLKDSVYGYVTPTQLALKQNISAVHYDTVQNAGINKMQRKKLNYSSHYIISDNSGNNSTDIGNIDQGGVTGLTDTLGKKIDSSASITINAVTKKLYTSPSFSIVPLTPGTVYVTDYGADSTGVNPSAWAFAAAIATGKTVIVPPTSRFYKIDTTVLLNPAQKIIGFGKRSLIKTSTIGGASPFNIFQMGDSSIIDGLAFKGSGYAAYSSGPTFTYQNAVWFPGSNATVQNCYCDSMSGSFVQAYHPSLSLVNYNSILNCTVTNSSVGVLDYVNSEYITIENLRASNNDYNLIIFGGNHNISNCHLDYGVTTNLKLNGTSNGDHGTFTGCSFNHASGDAATLLNTPVGELFTACNFFYGQMHITDCDNLSFVNCTLYTPTITTTASTTTKITSFKGGYYDPTITFTTTGTAKVMRIGMMAANDNRYLVNADSTEISGTLKVKTLNSGTAGTDSLVVVNNGILKRIVASYYSTFDGKLSSILPATTSNTINHGNNTQEWQWNSLTGTAFKLSTNSTTASGEF